MHDPYAVSQAAPAGLSVKQVSLPLASAKGWMKLLGVVMIIQGVLAAITIVGIIIAWLPIWIGVLLLQAAGAAERAQYGDDAAALMESLGKLRTYFVVQGVLILVGIVLTVLYFIFFGAIFFAALSHHGALMHQGVL